MHRTKDGSPTLSFGDGEWMHNSIGALTETAFLYGEVIENAINLGLPKDFLNVGLGLGYSEMWVLATCPPPFRLTSFEASADLTDQWGEWLEGNAPPIAPALREAAHRVGERFSLSSETLRERLQAARAHGWWQLLGPLQSSPLPTWSVALFDPFSRASSPELWTPTQLDLVLEKALTPAVLSTYAAQGCLNQALQRHGFHRHRRRGAGKKRESTLAFKGVAPRDWTGLL